jgi:hypothetical protein
MTIISYTIVPGRGPNLDRLADSWRYYPDPNTQVLVTFTVTRDHRDPDGSTHEVTLDVTGEAYRLECFTDSEIRVKLRPIDDEGRRMPSKLDVDVWYNPLDRSGKLDWIVRGY